MQPDIPPAILGLFREPLLHTYFAKGTTLDELHCLEIAFAAVQDVLDFDTPLQVFLNLLLELQSQCSYRSTFGNVSLCYSTQLGGEADAQKPTHKRLRPSDPSFSQYDIRLESCETLFDQATITIQDVNRPCRM